MKKLAVLLSFSILTSCATTKYSIEQGPKDFDLIRSGTKYNIYDKHFQQHTVTIRSVENDSIKGLSDGKDFVIAKNDIRDITENNNNGTAMLVTGIALGVGSAFLIINAIVKGSEKLGEIIGGVR